ncbi:MAG: hypothetical protein M1482_16185 [Chloroflexi bacterium]|nr:hypothetical protein [Chloroflexota bacterium]
MEPSILVILRDLAVILLVLEVGAMLVGPLVALFFVVQGLRWVKRKIRSPLLQAQLWAMRIDRGATRVSGAVVEVPISIQTAAVRASITTRGVVNYVLGR